MSTKKTISAKNSKINATKKETLLSLVDVLKSKGFSIREIGERAKFGKYSLETFLTGERQGTTPTAKTFRMIKEAFEFELTGKRTMEFDQHDLIQGMANEIERLRAYIKVLITEIASTQSPSNVSGRKLEITKICQEEAERQIEKM